MNVGLSAFRGDRHVIGIRFNRSAVGAQPWSSYLPNLGTESLREKGKKKEFKEHRAWIEHATT